MRELNFILLVAAFVIVSGLGILNLKESGPYIPSILDRVRDFDFHAIMQVVVSFFILGVSSFLILSHNVGTEEKHWAFGATGTVLGYWLRGDKGVRRVPKRRN